MMNQARAGRRRRGHTSRRARAISELLERRLLFSDATEAPYEFVGPAMAKPDSVADNPYGAPLTPALMRSAYGLGAYNASNITFNGVQGDGRGQTIALFEGGNDPNIVSDLSSFDTFWNFPAPPSFNVLNDTGGTSLASIADVSETALDVEWAHVMAPAASLVIYEGSVANAVETAKAAAGVSVISVSYSSKTHYFESDFATPVGHNGVTTLASAGDTGGETEFPSSNYSVVAVGGTALTLNGSAYGSESAWAKTGGGITVVPQQSYQTGIVSAWSTTNRTTPDVAMDGQPSTGVAVYDSYTNGTATPWRVIVGGTSLSTPLFAGIIAVVDQGRVAAGLTTLDGYTQTLPRLYSLSNSDFHDITTGNNGNPATVGYDLTTGLGSPIANHLIPDLAGADTITGRVFTDNNGNGVFDGADVALAGKTVYLDLNNDGTMEDTEPSTTTDSNGNYTFADQIGSETGTVRLMSPPSGNLHSTAAGTFVTSYNQTQTINIGFFPTTFAAAASPGNVTTTFSNVSVTGVGPLNAASFLYTWSATNTSFSPNGTSPAKNSTATFIKTGSYVLTLVIDDTQGCTITSTVNVTVSQTSALSITPTSASIGDLATRQFAATAVDQFGNALSTQPRITWTIDSGGVGSIDSTGVYTSPNAGPGTATVRATAGTLTATSPITVNLSIINGTSGDDIIRLVRSGSNVLVYENDPITPLYNVLYSTIANLLIAGGAGNDTINVDFSGGASPVPTSGITVDGGTLIVTGTSAADTVVVNASTVTFDGFVITCSNIESILVNGNGGADSLAQTAQPGNGAVLMFNTTALSSLNISSGTYTFAAPAIGGGVVPLSLAALTIGSTAQVSLPTATTHSDRWVLIAGFLSVTTGQLDLGGNDLLVHNASTGAIFQALQSGFANGTWNGAGIASSAAHADVNHLTALGMMPGKSGGTFDGQPTVSTDILVKYTYYGDANLDGVVDGSDYSRIDFGYIAAGQATGWVNGDFNYDSVINGSDYTLIDNAFNTQTASFAAVAFVEVAVQPSAVPGWRGDDKVVGAFTDKSRKQIEFAQRGTIRVSNEAVKTFKIATAPSAGRATIFYYQQTNQPNADYRFSEMLP